MEGNYFKFEDITLLSEVGFYSNLSVVFKLGFIPLFAVRFVSLRFKTLASPDASGWASPRADSGDMISS